MSKLLITGVTGFLGGAVLEHILNNDLNYDFLLQVRAHDTLAGLERVKENMRKFNLSEDKLQRITRSNIVIGDLAEPDQFLSDPRLDEVTHVINCAAVTSFSNNPLIHKVNVDGTLALAKRMEKNAGMTRFLHVGTAMSCVPEPDSLVLENADFSNDSEHLVEYTQSKSMIEFLIRTECPDLPLLIARPSIVVGHTLYGCQPSNSIYWVFRMGLMLETFMCSLDDKIDVIPADYCAEALLMLLESDLPDGEVVHISAGEQGSVTFAEIDIAMAAAQNKAPVGEKYTIADYNALVKSRHELKNIFGPCNERLMLKAMRLYGSFAALNVRFSNEKLLAIGMPQSPRFTDYIASCVRTSEGLTVPEQMAVDFK